MNVASLWGLLTNSFRSFVDNPRTVRWPRTVHPGLAPTEERTAPKDVAGPWIKLIQSLFEENLRIISDITRVIAQEIMAIGLRLPAARVPKLNGGISSAKGPRFGNVTCDVPPRIVLRKDGR